MTLTQQDFDKVLIAIYLDDYLYEKNTRAYFDAMPILDLVKSQLIFVNDYIAALEDVHGTTKSDFEAMLGKVIEDNKHFKEVLEKKPNSSSAKKYFKLTERLIKMMTKYRDKY